MSRKTILAISAAAALAFAAACNNDNGNTNANATNANTNANANRNANMNANANANANSNATNWNMTHEEYNKNEAGYRAEAKSKNETIGQDVEDGWIHFKVRGALALVSDLRDSTINVDVEKKVVTLRGSVANADQKAKAEKAAHVDGVAKVVDKLEIKSDNSNSGNKNTNSNANAHAAANVNKKA
ncbi:MAG TPA: BON domain-containing protein [Pyrinomonadaceae bacterium]|nr:BON domain-containing protein [Pyrinomonadaceae bacterium]